MLRFRDVSRSLALDSTDKDSKDFALLNGKIDSRALFKSRMDKLLASFRAA